MSKLFVFCVELPTLLKRSLPSRTLPVPPCSNSTQPVPVPRRCPGTLGTLWGPPQEDCFALGHVNHKLIPSDLKSLWPAFKIWFLQPAPLNATKNTTGRSSTAHEVPGSITQSRRPRTTMGTQPPFISLKAVPQSGCHWWVIFQ